jgi:predicted DNA-binding transcriptional regulator YafY
VIGTSDAMRRLHRRVRVVPDGLGRLRAQIAPGIQETVISAIVNNRQLRIIYLSRAGMAQGQARNHDLSVLGLVSKDSTVYLLGAKGVSDAPLTFALHRIRQAQALPQAASERPDFDLDDYIARTSQLSHTIDSPETIELHLRVRADSVWHFSERPLCTEQDISPSPDAQGWHAVCARLTNTTLLVPFLLSMGEIVIVDGPPQVRSLLLRRLSDARALYEDGSSVRACPISP